MSCLSEFQEVNAKGSVWVQLTHRQIVSKAQHSSLLQKRRCIGGKETLKMLEEHGALNKIIGKGIWSFNNLGH